jgi:Kelch motif protein
MSSPCLTYPHLKLTMLICAAGALLTACEQDPTGAGDVTQPTSLHTPSPYATVSLGTWVAKRPPPIVVPGRPTVGLITNRAGQPLLVLIGGNVVQAYNPSTNTWSRLADLPQARISPAGATTINNKLYLPGGATTTRGGEAPGHQMRTLYVYNPATNTWSREVDMPMTNVNGLSFTVNGLLYVLWGSCSYKDCPSSPHTRRFLFSFNPANKRWTRRADALHRHHGGGGALIDGKFYATGGSSRTPALDVYDPMTDTWTAKAKPPVLRSRATAAAVGKKLYVMGGFEAGGAESTGRVDRYDPVTNKWTLAPPLRSKTHIFRNAVRITVGAVPRIFAPGNNGSQPGEPVSTVNEMFTP